MGLGYRQKAILNVLDGRSGPVPFGLLVRKLDAPPTTVSIALRLLRERGLVIQARRGWWAAA